MRYIIVFLSGVIVATVGFSGIAQLLDSGVNKVKNTVQEQVKD
jgi:uncharacterized membrane protein YtjA (UPF0391 family)